jgi:iron complex transport system substrate-binding protein
MDVDSQTLGRWRRVAGVIVMALGLAIAVAPATTVQAARAQATPARIVSLAPNVTEMLFAIGAGPDVVGVSSFDTFPPEVTTRTKVGGLVDPNIERILSLKPTLVVAYGSQTELKTRLAAAGIPVFDYAHGSLADVTATMRALGRRLGRDTAAESAAARVERDLAAVRARVAGLDRPRTLLVFGREAGSIRSIYVSGGYGFLNDLLEVAGGANVFADIRRENIQISSEQVLARAPEAIVELRGPMTPGRRDAERQVWQQLPGVPAVKTGRIHLLQGEWLTVPGPRVADAARVIADALHPPR